MQQTLQLAESALKQGELPIAAIVVLHDEIIAQATTGEKQQKRFLAHAEMQALDMADRLHPFPGKRRDVTLYTNLEPCMMCMGAAMSFFLGEIVYGVESKSDGAVALAQSWQRDESLFPGYQVPRVIGGVLRGENGRLFQKYTQLHPPGPMVDWAKSIAEQISGENEVVT